MAPHLSLELKNGWNPEVVAHEGELSICVALAVTILNIKEVSAAEEGFIVPPVAINSINSDSLFLPVNYYSFVKAFLGRAKVFVEETKVLVSPLNNFHCVGIQLAHPADSNVLLY